MAIVRTATEAFAKTVVNAKRVGVTSESTTTGTGRGVTDAIAHVAINTQTDNVFKKMVLGLEVTSGDTYDNGTAAAGGTITFTFDATESTVSGTPDGKSITLTSSDGEIRTYTIRERTAAAYADNMDFNGFTTGTDRVGLTVPTSVGGAGAIINIQLCNDTDGSTSAGPGVIGVGTSGASASTVAEAVVDAINGADSHGRVHFGSGISSGGVVGLTAAIGTSGTKVSLTATTKGAGGNDIVVANTAGDAATAANLSGGSGPNTSTKNEFDAGTTATETAVNFKAAVDGATHGHGTARFTTAVNSSAGVVLVTAVDTGIDTNTVVTRTGFDDICSVNATNYFTGGAAAIRPQLSMQFSHNGSDWAPGIPFTDDLLVDVAGLKLITADFSGYTAPYARIVFNENGANIGATGTHKAIYAV